MAMSCTPCSHEITLMYVGTAETDDRSNAYERQGFLKTFKDIELRYEILPLKPDFYICAYMCIYIHKILQIEILGKVSSYSL